MHTLSSSFSKPHKKTSCSSRWSRWPAGVSGNMGICYYLERTRRTSRSWYVPSSFQGLPKNTWYIRKASFMYEDYCPKREVRLFLTLLVFTQQSYCHGSVVRPSVHPSVRNLKFLRNHCMYPGQILWVAPSPPYIFRQFFSFFNIFNFQIFSSAWLCQQSYCRGAGVRRPSSSVKRVFSEAVQQINAKFCGKVAIHHISRPFFPFLKNLDFWILTIFFRFR